MSDKEAPKSHFSINWSSYHERFCFPIEDIWFVDQKPSVLSDGRIVIADGPWRYRVISTEQQRTEFWNIPHIDIEYENIAGDGSIVTLGHRDGKNKGPFVVRMFHLDNPNLDREFIEPRFSNRFMFRPSFASTDTLNHILLVDIFGRICSLDLHDESLTLMYHVDGEIYSHQDIHYAYEHYYDNLKRGVISPFYSNHTMVRSQEHISKGFEVQNMLPIFGQKVAILRQDSWSDPMITRQQIVVVDLDKRRSEVAYECVQSVLGAGRFITHMEAAFDGSLILFCLDGDTSFDTELSFRKAVEDINLLPQQMQDVASGMDDSISRTTLVVIRPVQGAYRNCRKTSWRIPDFDSSNPNTREYMKILPDGQIALVQAGEESTSVYIYEADDRSRIVNQLSIPGSVYALEVLPDMTLACVRTIRRDDTDIMQVLLWK